MSLSQPKPNSPQSTAIHKAKLALVRASTQNMAKRLNQVLEIVNREIPSSFDPFVVTKDAMKQMFQDVKNTILSWRGPSNYKPTMSNTEITQSSIKWFNKHNAKIYGNFFFYPIFIHILKFCNGTPDMDNNTKMHLFVSILLRILKSKIKCIGTREQSLLLLQCIVSSNKFKSILKKFIDHFYVKYNMDHTTSIEQVPLIFINALSKIEQMLLSATTESVEYRLFTATLPSRVVDLTNNENRNHHNHNNRLSIDSFMTDSTMSDTTQTMSSSCSVSTVSSIPSQSSDSILLNRANYSQNHGNIHRAEQQNNFMSPLANSNQLSLPSLPSLQQTNMNTMNNNGYNVMNLQNNINIMNGLTTPINTNMLNVNPLNINNNPNINMNMMGLLNMMNNNANMVNNGNNINMNQVFNNNQIPSMGLLNTTNMNMNMMSQNPNINTNIPNINMIPITNNLINPTMSNMNTNNNNNNVNVMEALNIMNMVNNSSDNNNTTNITPASNSTTPTPTDSIMEVKDPETNKMVKYKIISFNPLVIEKIAVKDNEKETTQIKESKNA